MASIARTAGVSAGLLHYHFDTKELLFGEVLTYSHAVSADLNQRALARAGEGPAERLSSFLDRCLPSDEQRAHEWLLWQELALLCIRDPHLAKVGADLYEDLYVTIADIVREGLTAGVFDTDARPEVAGRDRRRPHRRPRRPGPGERPQPRDRAGAVHHRGHRRRPGRPRRPAPGAGTVRGRGAGVTPRPGLELPRPSRRGLLTGGLALGASMTLPGCAYIRDDAPEDAPLPPSAKAEIDGDLVYFNWADYFHPKTVKGFQEEYGVKVIESNYDSMEGMYAKLAAGNQYDVVFPIAKWVVKLRREGKLRSIDPDQLQNAEQVFYSGSYFNEPWYDAGSQVSVPFTVYKTGIGWRTDKVSSMTGSWQDLFNEEARGRIFTLDDQDEALAMAALLLGYDVNTAKASELEEMKELLIEPEGVPPRVLLRRHQQHAGR